jgi:predicted protein tyrosine phosphatase
MKIVFVCTHNICRSRLAQEFFAEEGFETKSAGILDNFITADMIKWADKIVVMEAFHKQAILDRFPHVEEKIVVLNIPDVYCRGNPDLEEPEFLLALIGRMNFLGLLKGHEDLLRAVGEL